MRISDTGRQIIQVGDTIHTPRFLTVHIAAILTEDEAYSAGYTEPTHYDADPCYDILGKHTGDNRMQFAAVIK